MAEPAPRNLLPEFAKPIRANRWGVYRVGTTVDGVYWIEIIGENAESYYHVRADKGGAPHLRSLRKKEVVARFASKAEMQIAIERGVEAWEAHDAAIQAARRVLTDTQARRLDAWKRALSSA